MGGGGEYIGGEGEGRIDKSMYHQFNFLCSYIMDSVVYILSLQ